MKQRRIKLPAPVAAIYRAVAELEATYPLRKFTPDGHVVGSIGEVIAAEALSLNNSESDSPWAFAFFAVACTGLGAFGVALAVG
jgi:hypothetical protein